MGQLLLAVWLTPVIAAAVVCAGWDLVVRRRARVKNVDAWWTSLVLLGFALAWPILLGRVIWKLMTNKPRAGVAG